ncbi:MAG: hypothetical protein ACYDCD_04930 [Candidatus Acidiferrales bacterium]
MAQTFLIFDFGTDEDAVQEARHRIEGWKQGFRLGKKIEFKFERRSLEEGEESEAEEDDADSKSKRKEFEEGEAVRLIVRLDFSNHEKNLAQTWVERIPADEAFAPAKGEVIRANDAAFEKTREIFESLK